MVKNNFEPMMLKEVATATGLATSSASRVLDNMIECGWVEKTPDRKYQLTAYFDWLADRRKEVIRLRVRAEMERAAYFLSLKENTSYENETP